MIADPWFYLAGVGAVLLVGISKGGFGGATGLMAVPLMALFIPPTTAAAIMLPLLCAMDVIALKLYWRKWDVRQLQIMIPAALVGIGVGATSFHVLDEHAIRLMIGVLALLFAVYTFAKELLPPRPPAGGRRPISGAVWGGAAGFTSFVAHAGGPPTTIHMLPLGLDKTTYQATTVGFYAVVNAAKLLPYVGLGLFDGSTLLTSLVLAPFVPAGVWLGLRLHDLIAEKWFYRIIVIGLAATGTKLIADALAGG